MTTKQRKMIEETMREEKCERSRSGGKDEGKRAQKQEHVRKQKRKGK